MMKYFYGIFSLFLLSAPLHSTAQEQLILFEQKAAQSAYMQSALGKLDSVAEALGIPLVRVDVDKVGAPEEIHYTPALVFQNYRGRSMYKGRFSSYNRIENFIRTVRRIPQKGGDFPLKDVLVWKNGRTNTRINIKMTKVTGKRRPKYDEAEVLLRIKKAIAARSDNFEFVEDYTAQPQDQVFYFDFYPYLNFRKLAFVTFAMYSRFDCINPIYTNLETPIVGPWRQIDIAISTAALVLEGELIRQINGSASRGDAYTPIASTTASPTWESLNLARPEAPAQIISAPDVQLKLAQDWVFEAQDYASPVLQFRFQAPLEQYAGEVQTIDGKIHLNEALSFQEAEGHFEVQTASLTMGFPDLDKAIHDKLFEVVKFPAATFEFKKIHGDLTAIDFGKVIQLQIEGDLKMHGAQQRVTAPTQVELILNEFGAPRLMITASFLVDNLSETFGIEGPPGPKAAQNTMIFDMHFVMKPK